MAACVPIEYPGEPALAIEAVRSWGPKRSLSLGETDRCACRPTANATQSRETTLPGSVNPRSQLISMSGLSARGLGSTRT